MVYGHSTSGGVDLYSYAEFDAIDQNDRYRLMDISARGSNRDGAALRYVAERLARRAEDVKLLMLVSDGQPADTGYFGTAAEEDLRGVKQEYQRIAFELSLGEPFEAVIQDLNIINVHAEYYDLTLHCKGGTILSAKSESLDLFSRDKLAYVYLDDDRGDHGVQAVFSPADCAYDMERNAMILPGNRISLTNNTANDVPFDGKEEANKDLVPEYMTISRATSRNIHYLTA